MNAVFPDSAFTIDHDELALAVITHEGLLGKFPSHGDFTSGRVLIIEYAGHKTHWLVAVQFAGHSDPKDNGYRIYGFPKNAFGEDILKRQAEHIVQTHGDPSRPAIVKTIKPNAN